MMNNPVRKHIWIINEYAGSPYHGMEFRHYYLSKALIKLGYNVTIISASCSHLFKTLPNIKERFTTETIDNIQYVWIKVPSYKSSHSKRRVLKWFVYTCSLYFLPVKKISPPDFIILSPMQTMPIMPALYWKKKFNVPLVFEIKDIWPLSIQELGGYSSNHPFIRVLKYFEKTAIQKSDAIVSVLPNYGQYLKDEGIQKNFEYIPNGIDISEMQNTEPLSPEIEKQIPKDKFIVIYTGTLGKANALQFLIQAASLLKDYQDILFLIVGDGSEKEQLLKQAEGMNNILFIPSIPKRQIQNILKKADVCYIGLEKSNLFHYGVSPNKIFDYMYAARPIIFAVSSYNSVVEQAKCGIVTQADNPKEIAKSILEIYRMPIEKRMEIGNNGKNFVIQHHTFDALALKYDKLFQQLKKGNC